MKLYFFTSIFCLLFLACEENVKGGNNQDLMNQRKASSPQLFKHADKEIEKYQNFEIQLSFADIEKLIQKHCQDEEKAITKEEVTRQIKKDDSYIAPHTDKKNVVQLSFKDIEIKQLNLSYNKEEFECQGYANISISKINWSGKIKIPQGFRVFKMIQEARK